MKENLIILGGGESGVGAAVLGKKQGYNVFLSDSGNMAEKYKAKLENNGIEYEEGEHTESRILEADLVVKSPGIPEKAPLIQALRKRNINIISEIEFGSRYTKAKIVAITGSNGKTTTTSLLYDIMKEAGLNVGLGGNIGQSFALQVAEGNYDFYVLEVSSFQLDDIVTFRPFIAVLLNITPDHLDRYENKFEKYARTKFKITENQTHEDYFVYDFDDSNIMELIKKIDIKSKKIPYSMQTPFENGTYKDDDENVIVNYPDYLEYSIGELKLKGKHNIYNSMAAATAANILNIRDKTLKKSLYKFTSIEHRLEFVLKLRGVEFINDSKATNINSAYYALESMTRPVIWIVGGEDKGNDYSELNDLVIQKVKTIVCLGVDNSKIIDAYKDVVEDIVETRSMRDAVNAAFAFGDKGDTVLLSPCCASFDLFKSYEDRGQQFKKEVKNL